MSAAEVPGPGKPNGSGGADAVPARRTAGRRRAADATGTAPGQKLAGFAATGQRLVDVEMWAAQSLVWLQPDFRPALPASSGLRIRRRYGIPAADFLNPGAAPAGRSPVLERAFRWLAPARTFQIPRSDLAPRGWDPRALIPHVPQAGEK